jgi:putative hydrolase of the HAD superfamily
MIRAILFDLDMTLIDFMEMKRRSCEAAVSAMTDAGLCIDKDKAMRIIFEMFDKHGYEYHLIFQKFLRKVCGTVDPKVLAAGIVAYRRVKLGYLEPYPGVNSTLLHLKERGIRLAIVSDAPRLKAWMRLTATRLADFFDVVVTSEDTGAFKPSKKPFLLALKKLKIRPDECLMIGDWPERDIIGAKKLGIPTCFARYGYHQRRKVRDSGADYEISKFADLIGIIAKLNRRQEDAGR